MGGLLSLMRGGGAGDDAPVDLPLNFDGSEPTAEEAEIFELITQIMKPSSVLLEDLKNYQGCGDFIRKAISTPGPETEQAAWAAVCPAVVKLKNYYELALKLEDGFPKLLGFLVDGSDIISNLEKRQATAKLLADILHFASEFDELKMGNPSIQNDFSYYRRTLSRMKMSNLSTQNFVVPDELANRMSLFYANANPMSKTLVDSATAFINGQRNGPVTDLFAIFAGITYNAVFRSRVQGDLVDYALRVMVGSIILYDHVSATGAFAKGSKINIRLSVKLIQTNGGPISDSLLNTIRYTTLHLNDEATPKATKALLN